MTISEKICQELNRKFYFDDFVLTNLYYMKNGVEQELCDGLVEFENCYLIIQIKERNITESSDDQKWLEKKVYKKAVSQIKDTIAAIRENVVAVEDLRGKKVELDFQKDILPLIIFRNENIEDYRRVYHSQSLDLDINILSESDYEKMMQVLKMPVDILDYLYLRKELFSKGNFNLIIDDSSENFLAMAKIKSEEDFVDYFLRVKIKGSNYDENAIHGYLNIIRNFYNNRTEDCDNYKDILYRLIRLDRFGAKAFFDRWMTTWIDSRKGEFNCSCHMVMENNIERFGFLFISSQKGRREDNLDFYQYLTELFIQNYHLDTAIAIIIYDIDNKEFFANWLMLSRSFQIDEELQELLKEKNPWKNVIEINQKRYPL